MRCHLKSRFPAANINHLPNMVSYDTLFWICPPWTIEYQGMGVHNNANFYTKPSKLVYVVPLVLNGMFLMLSRIFLKMGGPVALLSNSATKNKNGAIKDLEQYYNISSHHYSKPGYQNQNWVENKLGILRIWLIISWTL